jgi:type II secretory pathway pseudopilin PulG
MKPESIRAFALIEVLMLVLLVSTISGMGSYALVRTLAINRRVAAAANDEATTEEIMRHLRRDAAAADGAKLTTDATPVLTLRQATQQVRYRSSDKTVVRTVQHGNQPPVQRTWRFQRTRLRWHVERSPRGGSMVWAAMSRIDSKQPAKQPKREYAVGIRVGSLKTSEVAR